MTKHMYILVIGIVFSIFLAGCSAPVLPPVKVEASTERIDYLADVKPILDNRCVSCHSCYNSPCQAKMSSFDGVDRGASKILVYDNTRLSAIDPTRLFIDATSTEEWHENGFYSITDNFDANGSYNDSIMIQMLFDKKNNPEIVGDYSPETDDLICPRDRGEMDKYVADKPNHGMPYGFPALKDKEYTTLAQWLQQGAHGPTDKQQKEISSPSKAAAVEIKKWEAFFNNPDPKHAMTSRYLYEHLYLAHWNFKAAPTEFYEIVRSKTPSPEPVELIPSLRPFDDPGVDKFYYRFTRFYSTPVIKTHMVVEFDDKKLARFKELFIEPTWIETPHVMDYDSKRSANAFSTYYQIPGKSRYQFLLDNNNFIVMSFIRGPVCRGQMALNSINDHFWVMFKDPKADITIQEPTFLLEQADNLSLPIETLTESVWKAFNDDYLDKYKSYFVAKEKRYAQEKPEGYGMEAIWKGNSSEDSPLLTIYRHFDSGSVHRGVVGGLPKTLWVIDFPQFERLYYGLVAGYDVYGNLPHQTNIRRYMDFLRKEGELNFLNFMPHEDRLTMLKSWYIDADDVQDIKESDNHFPLNTTMTYKSNDPKHEFIEEVVNHHILKSTHVAFDDINYFKPGEKAPQMPTSFTSIEDIKTGMRSLTVPGTGFIKTVADNNANLLHVRVAWKNGKKTMGTLVINRWHNNVNSLFLGEQQDSSKDTLDFVHDSIGSYPNVFVHVNEEDLADFFDMLQNYEATPEYRAKFEKYFVSRSDDDFWDMFDWFQDDLNKKDPVRAGLYDINRYAPKSW